MNSTPKSTTSVKFLSLPVGGRFRWQGAIYVKTSPLIARNEVDGTSQLIQRAALVEPLDAQTAARATTSGNARETLLEDYHRDVLSGLDELRSHAPPRVIAKLRQHIEEAHRRARKKLRDTQAF